MPATTHRSKIDTWLLLVFVVTMVFGLFPLWSWVAHPGASSGWAALLSATVACGLPLWLLMDTRYTLDDEALHVRYGPFRGRVPLAEISKVAPTRNPVSGPALSLDRLAVTHANGRRVTLISPRDQAAFLRDLAARRQAISRSASA